LFQLSGQGKGRKGKVNILIVQTPSPDPSRKGRGKDEVEKTPLIPSFDYAQDKLYERGRQEKGVIKKIGIVIKKKAGCHCEPLRTKSERRGNLHD
jgi:hypothetical protein